MNDQLIGRLLNEFEEMFAIFFPNKNREYVLNNLNTGCCGLAAMCVGNVLVRKYNYKDVRWSSHPLHMWLTHNGVHYDTLWPEGHPDDYDPTKSWLLHEVGYNDDIYDGPMELDANSGYYQLGYQDCLYLTKCWYTRHGVELPGFVSECFNKIRSSHKDFASRKFRNRLESRYKKALNMEFDLTAPVVTNNVYPMTHYWHGEFEDDCSRVLKKSSWMTSVKTWKKLFKEYREKGIEITRL